MAARAPAAQPERIISIVGTRPEAIKLAPVASAFARCGIPHHVLLTGQHAGLESAFAGYDTSSLTLDLRDLSVEEQRARLRRGIRPYLAAFRPDLVLVQGDTTSALAGALAARDCGLPVGHIEAGLRSFDLTQPYPEEENRVTIDALSSLLFAPTDTAAGNLAAEPAVRGTVHVTGNTGIDALRLACGPRVQIPDDLPRKPILVTCHRRENRGATFADIGMAIRRLTAELPVEITYVLHKNRHTRAAALAALEDIPHLSLIEPQTHQAMVKRIQQSWALLTDSGGVQEDGATLGVPVLVMRNVTERVEAPTNIALVGTEPASIVRGVNDLLMSRTRYERMSVPTRAFGDGRAADRIAAIVREWLDVQAALAC